MLKFYIIKNNSIKPIEYEKYKAKDKGLVIDGGGTLYTFTAFKYEDNILVAEDLKCILDAKEIDGFWNISKKRGID